MVPTGLVTPLVLKAAAAFVDSSSLGNALGSGGSHDGTVLDEETGLEVELSLSNLVFQINSLSSQSWYQRLIEFLENFENGTSDQEIIDSWNNVVDEDGVFFDILGIYNKTTKDILGPSFVSGGFTSSGNFNTPLQLIPEWIAETIVGNSPDIDEETGNINFITGNVQKFSTAFAISDAYVSQQNQYINSVTALNNAESTFTDMNNWITSGLTGVTLEINTFGEDLQKTGRLLDLVELSQLGNPGLLINRLSQAGALAIIIDKLEEERIDVRTILDRQGSAPPVLLKSLYGALTNIGGIELENIKKVLQITTEGLETVADLLDPRKIFPNSYSTLRSPVFGSTVEYKLIYSDNSGGLSQEFNRLGGVLRSVMPSEIAAANAALSRSLGQITNIFSVSVEDFARALQDIETLKDIDFIQDQPKLVEEDVKNIWFDQSSPISLGTGERGTLVLADLIGIASGYNIVAPIQQNKKLFLDLESAGAFTPFTKKGSPDDPSIGFFQVIEHLLNGEYTTTTISIGVGGEEIISSYIITIPSGVKGEGTYSSSSLQETIKLAWFEGIYPELVQTTKDTVTNNFETANTIIENSKRWQIHRAREFLNRERLLEPDFFELPHAREDSLRFAQQLPQRALDTSTGGASQILEGIADRSTEAGQALIAVLREGRNNNRLESIGITTSSVRPIQ